MFRIVKQQDRSGKLKMESGKLNNFQLSTFNFQPKKFSIFVFILFLFLALPANAVPVPDNIQSFVESSFPKSEYRFDGVITLPDNTIYLPLMPAKIITPETIKIKETYPAGKTLKDKPNIVILNNDYVLMKVIRDNKGNRTILNLANPPIEVRTGLFPQDMLVPKGLVIPESMKAIIGNLDIPMSDGPGVRIERVKPVVTQLSGSTLKTLSQMPAFKNKNLYVSSPYSRNIQILNPGAKTPEYSLKQNGIPISMKIYDNQYLLVSSYDKNSVDVIALADDEIIKQVKLKSQPDEILIDKNKNIAYISSSIDSSIYVLNLETMNLFKQIRITGMCEKLTLSEDGTKLFYFDKKTNDIWAIELDNNYLLKEIGKFPNISKIVYTNNKIYITSRTKNRLAIIDYDTVGLIAEIPICEKPIDMLAYKDNVFVLGADDNSIQILDVNTDEITTSIYLDTNGFSTKISYIDGTNIAIITDTKASLYTIFDLDNKKVLNSVPIDIPANIILASDKVRKH